MKAKLVNSEARNKKYIVERAENLQKIEYM